MLDDRPIYVVDTNVIIDYGDIIADHADGQLAEPTVDLSHAHIVIPEAVVEELSSFKGETSDRGKAAKHHRDNQSDSKNLSDYCGVLLAPVLGSKNC